MICIAWLTIDQAASVTTVSCPANVTYTGSALEPCSVTVTGAGGLNNTPAPVYANNTNAGTASASYTYPGDANHTTSSDSKNFTINKKAATWTTNALSSSFGAITGAANKRQAELAVRFSF